MKLLSGLYSENIYILIVGLCWLVCMLTNLPDPKKVKGEKQWKLWAQGQFLLFFCPMVFATAVAGLIASFSTEEAAKLAFLTSGIWLLAVFNLGAIEKKRQADPQIFIYHKGMSFVKTYMVPLLGGFTIGAMFQ